MDAERLPIEILRRARAETVRCFGRELQEIDEAIAALERGPLGVNNLDPLNSKRTVRRNQWAGIKTTTALQVYLSERGGGPIPLNQILSDFRTAGVDLKTPDRQERTLKIIAANKPRVFRYDEHSDTIQLTSNGAYPT